MRRHPPLCLLVALALAVALQAGAAAAQKAFYLVRHAEKVDESRDAALSAAGRARAEELARLLRDADIKGVYVSEFQRNRDTAAPLCRARALTPQVVPSTDTRGLLLRARRDHPTDAVLIVAHANTLPVILETLGVREPVPLAASEYDNLFVVVPRPMATPLLLRLRMP